MKLTSLIDSYKEIISQGKLNNIISVSKKALESYKRANSGLGLPLFVSIQYYLLFLFLLSFLA